MVVDSGILTELDDFVIAVDEDEDVVDHDVVHHHRLSDGVLEAFTPDETTNSAGLF